MDKGVIGMLKKPRSLILEYRYRKLSSEYQLKRQFGKLNLSQAQGSRMSQSMLISLKWEHFSTNNFSEQLGDIWRGMWLRLSHDMESHTHYEGRIMDICKETWTGS